MVQDTAAAITDQIMTEADDSLRGDTKAEVNAEMETEEQTAAS